MSFFGLPTTSQQGRALEKQSADFHGPGGRRGAQGTGSSGDYDIWRWCGDVASFLSRPLEKPTDALPVGNTLTHGRWQAWRLRQRQEGSLYPVSPTSPHLSYHMAFFLPTPAYGSVSVWKLPRSDNLSSAGECVVTNTVSPGWMTSQLHSARETGLLCS